MDKETTIIIISIAIAIPLSIAITNHIGLGYNDVNKAVTEWAEWLEFVQNPEEVIWMQNGVVAFDSNVDELVYYHAESPQLAAGYIKISYIKNGSVNNVTISNHQSRLTVRDNTTLVIHTLY